MSNETGKTPFEDRAAALLRDGADSLDASTRSKLTRARHAALASISSRPAWLDLRVLAPGGALAAAVVAVVMWTGVANRPAIDTGGALDDIELLADADAYEISQESDLDFIEWAAAMGEQDVAGT